MTRRKLNRPIHSKCPEQCRICGGPSTGYHYDVPSCNGCKLIFRRSLLNPRKHVCAYDGNCAMRPQEQSNQKRRLCRACRFRRCVEAGMNPDAIEDASGSPRLIQRNEYELIPSPSSPETIKMGLLSHLLYVEDKYAILRASTYNPLPDSGYTIESFLNEHSPMGKKFPEMPSEHVETKRLFIDYHIEHRIPVPDIDFHLFPKTSRFWIYFDFICVLAWSGTLEFFSKLDRNDQYIILIESALQCINIHLSYYSYTHNSEKIIFPGGNQLVWMNKDNLEVIDRLKRLKIDKVEYSLLKILLLCNPSWDRLSERAKSVIIPYQQQYVGLLMDHCMKTHGRLNAASRAAEIMGLQYVMIQQSRIVKESIQLMTSLGLRNKSFNLIEEMCEIY